MKVRTDSRTRAARCILFTCCQVDANRFITFLAHILIRLSSSRFSCFLNRIPDRTMLAPHFILPLSDSFRRCAVGPTTEL